MKKWFAILTVAALLFTAGCNFKVKKNTFSIATENVKTVTLQKRCEDESGNTYYVEKTVDDKKEIKSICEKVRNTPLSRADSTVPQPINSVSYVIIIKSEIEQHFILNEEKAFFEQVAYEYASEKTLDEYASLYDSLNYAEVKAEPNLY